MILVQNHRPQLNGSRISTFLFIVFICTSCGILNPDKGGKISSEQPGTSEAEKTVRVYNPETGTYENVPENEVVVDTVTLRDITNESNPPIKEVETLVKGEKKSAYHFSLLMPFNARRYQNINDPVDARGRRFIQYYAGARLAIDDLMQAGIRVDLHVFDTEESGSKTSTLLTDPILRKTDLIIGPYRRANIESVSKFSRKNKIVTVSPWIPGFALTEDNPYLIQMTPGLEPHAQAIFGHIETNHPNTDVYIVSRNSERERSRLSMFRNAYRSVSSQPDSLIELMIDDSTSDLQNTDWLSIFENPRKAIFVVPYYSRSDEGFVNGVLRKIHAERLEKEVIVYGMPQWMSFRNINYDYLESLQVHLSTISHTDKSHSKYQTFSTRFYDRYGIVAEDPAFQGYDLVYYLGNAISENGTNFIPGIEGKTSSALNLGMNIKPVFEGSPEEARGSKPKYYENQGIRILRFENQAFHILR